MNVSGSVDLTPLLAGLVADVSHHGASAADDVRNAVKAQLKASRVPRGVWGTVSSPVVTTSPMTAMFTPEGASAPIGPVKCLATYSPVAGATALGLWVGSDLFLVAGQTTGGWNVVGASGQPAFQNGWAAFGGAYAPPRFRRLGNGLVVLSGLANRTPAIGNTVVFTLPAGYRPSAQITCGAWAFDGTNYQPGRIDVDASGNVISQPTGPTTQFVPLDSVRFVAEA